MSGYFENGAWIDESISPDEIEIGIKVRVDDSELDELVDRISETADYFRLMSIEQKVMRATFTERLWYLITGKL